MRPTPSRFLVPLLVTLTAIPVGIGAARKVASGDSYTSPSKLFTVTVPRACSTFQLQYELKETARTGTQFVEEAGLYIGDLGTLYRVGVRRLTREMREPLGQGDGLLPPAALAGLGLKIHLAERAKRAGDWRPASDVETPDTSFGRGVMSVNHVQQGRFIRLSTLEGNKWATTDRPAEIVVLVVQTGEHLLYATGQADLGSVECVQREVWKMLEGLKLSRPVS